MRAITKQGNGGYHLNSSHASPPLSAINATSRWGSFGYKSQVLDFLLDEQFHLCCYSELRADQEGLGYHIEHVENKSQNPQRTFDYTNLAASALGSSHDLSAFKAHNWAAFGGHSVNKQKSVDLSRFISCHQTDCYRFFVYLSDGRVVPKDNLEKAVKDKVLYTIDLLNLNSPYLIVLRQKWWDELDLLVHEHLQKQMDLNHLASIDLVPLNGKLSRFFSLTRQYFGQIAESVLQQQAPNLL